MKKIILAVAVCMVCITLVKAQGSKGNIFMGATLGTASYSSSSPTFTYSDGSFNKSNTKEFSLSVDPEIGVYLTDHFIFGGNLDVSYTHDKESQTMTQNGVSNIATTTDQANYMIGPFVRYYFFDKTPSKTLFYLQGSAAIGSGNNSSSVITVDPGGTNTSSTSSSGVFAYNLLGAIGITHYIQKNIGLDLGVAYVYSHDSYSENFGGNTTKVSGATNRLRLNAGFNFVLP